MSRLPIRDLILSKKRPQTTLSLVPAFQQQAGEMVETYIFTHPGDPDHRRFHAR